MNNKTNLIKKFRALLTISILMQVQLSASAYNNDPYMEFLGTCDASGAIPLNDDQFVVAGDEINILKLYSWSKPAEGQSINLAKLVPGVKEKTELDIEAATKIDNITFWISSHSRSKKKGKLKLDRHILFALKFKTKNGRTTASLVGNPYRNLLKDLCQNKHYKQYKLENFTHHTDLSRAGESKNGFNIEGACAWKKNKMLIGLRGPLIDDKAVLVPVHNPIEIVNGIKPEFGKPIKLNLDGYGIRGIEYIPKLNSYAILGGDTSKYSSNAIYLWSGNTKDKTPCKVKHPAFVNRFNPEAIFSFPNSTSLCVLSDDGNQKYNGVKCKVLEKKGNLVFFRATEIKVEK